MMKSFKRLIAGSVLSFSVMGCAFLQNSVEVASTPAVPEHLCVFTPSDMEGPYYIPDAPFKESLYPEGATGEPLVISGTVYAADCRTPLAGAVVDVWQADDNGEYDFSADFIGRGKVVTDENGNYTFTTILPGIYEPRPPHIHIKISHPDAIPLTTQIYFMENDNQGQQGAIITLTREGDTLQGVFDVVLGNS